MQRQRAEAETVLRLDLSEGEGTVLDPMGPAPAGPWAAWETPLAPWGGFKLPSGLAVGDGSGGRRLVFNGGLGEDGVQERALVSRAVFGDGALRAKMRCLGRRAGPHMDRMQVEEAWAGVVFGWQTSRRYFAFGVEGGRRAVLYRRDDDEWLALAGREVALPEGWIELDVSVDGMGLRCRCAALNVDFAVTDPGYRAGKVGFRALQEAELAAFEVLQTPGQARDDEVRGRNELAALEARGSRVPAPELAWTLDHKDLGGAPRPVDLAVEGRFDLLVEGEPLRAYRADGSPLWLAEVPVRNIVWGPPRPAGGRLLYGFTGERSRRQAASVTGKVDDQVVYDEMCVLDGRDGRLLARAAVPPMHPTARRPDFSAGSGNLTGGDDIVLREWRDDKEGGGVNLWAYDVGLNPLWHREQSGAWYGHHWAVRFFDVDGDGRDELLAGGKLYDAGGRLLWEHDRDAEMMRIRGARHYDAVAVGDLAGDAELDPTVFLISGSAGVYVVDGLTGRTRARHAVGHAQGCLTGKMRADLPGTEVLVATRWGNMGILTLFSGRGRRLWTIQPDGIGQGACPLWWGDDSQHLVWTNTSAAGLGLYDGFGKKARLLPELARLWGERPRREVGAQAARLGDDGLDYMCLSVDGKTYAFGPGA